MDNPSFFRRTILAIGCLLLVFAGCSNEPRQYDISGAVTYQGQPLADGQIVLEGAAASDRAIGVIKDGRYQLRATAGEKLVRISGSKPTGRMLPGAMDTQIPEMIPVVPEKYNRDSNEQRTVEAKQPQTIDFDLQ